MDDNALTPDQQVQINALEIEFMKQMERVGVDFQGVGTRLRESQPPVERRVSDDEFEVALTVDLSAIVDTLRVLPDAAGTEAFVAAYNARP